ncbi:hypothetical protein ACFX2J_012789 [Malus domestica]
MWSKFESLDVALEWIEPWVGSLEWVADALGQRLLALGLHGHGPSWPLGYHILACWLGSLGLGPLSCLASRSCGVLGFLPIGLEMDLGLLPKVWLGAALQRQRRWKWCRGLVALPWLLGHSNSGGAAPR